jgi:3-methylcrotonyl-CoA carboxylase alpha subunit
MEMNTRIQVEHPVTEAVTSTDLITWQLQIANGKKLPKLQNEIIIDGWAIEARLYAEDAKKNFMPQIGLINHFTLPNQLKHPNCFMETGTKLGDFISPYYDPMIGKIISHGRNRNEAIKNLTSYLSEFEIAGITTNLDLLKKLLKDNDFKKGNINTKFVENNIIKFVENNIPNADIALTGLIVFKNLIKNQDNYWSMWRPSHYPIKLLINNTIYSFNFIYSKLDEIEVHFDELRYKLSSIKIFNSSLFARLNKKDLSIRYNVFKEKNLGKKMFTIFTENNTYQAQIFNPLIITENQKRFSPDKIISPMHGIIKFKSIKKNLHVKKGEVLMLLEAMKMQYSLTSPRDGIIEKIYIKDGEQAIEGMELLSLKEKNND